MSGLRRLVTRYRGSHRDPERGATLVELSVVLLIMSIVMAMILRGFLSFQNDAASNDVRLENLDEARVLMATITKDMRTAAHLTASTAPFLQASDAEVKFFANIDTTQAPKLVHLYVNTNTVLIEEATPADAGSVAPDYTYTGAPVVRFVGRYVANPTTLPIFTYYDADGNVLTPDAVTKDLSDADKLAVVSVSITLAIRKVNAQNVPYTTLVNRVSLPNVYFNPPSPSP